MKGIEFRGKARMSVEELNDIGLSHSNGWVYGNLIQSGGLTFVVGGVVDWCEEYLAHEWWVLVDPKTVGQYTGLKDKNNAKIFEGDFLKDDENVIWKVFFRNGAFYVECDDLMAAQLLSSMIVLVGNLYCEVIGNKFDHPELLNN